MEEEPTKDEMVDIEVELNDKEYEILCKAAKLAGMSNEDYLTQVVMEMVKKLEDGSL